MRLGVIGASGKTGSKVVSLAKQDKAFHSITGVDTRKTLPLPSLDILIDFSTKEALAENLSLAQSKNYPIVIGTTGLELHEKKLLQQASEIIPVFWAPNFSLGMATAVYISSILSSLLGDFTFHIEETHHKYKKDAPSGSALALKEAIKKPTPIESFRIEEVIGEHTVFCRSKEEELTLSHKALSRDVFAKGALAAAKFLFRQKPGLYGMKDLLTAEMSKS